LSRSRRSRWCLLLLASVAGFTAPPAHAAAKRRLPDSEPLTQERTHPSGAFSFRIPDSWTAGAVPDDPDILEATGDDLIVRFWYRAGEVGYDSLHATCMLQRLWGHMDADPEVGYEYDYIGGAFGSRRALDSAFVVNYETPFRGHRKWRQRNLTIVGGGHSLCLVAHAPVALWKKPQTRSLLEAVFANVKFRD
jgi:hypothetical protein